MFLSKSDFTQVIQNTPLVSIDLIVKNADGEALLGERTNKPAQGMWFVPGGRILKNESLASAFKRLTFSELGTEFSIEEASLKGPFDHFYDDCVFGDTVSTHYVAIAYEIILTNNLSNLPTEQHSTYKWFTINELLRDNMVHAHTKWYFK